MTERSEQSDAPGDTPHHDTRLGDLIGYHLKRASVVDLNGAVAALEPLAIRTVPLSVLFGIVDRPGTNAAEICRSLGMQRANIAPILAELERRGCFLREADPQDSRVQRLYPTRKGEDEARRALDLLAAHEERLLARLTKEERQSLRRMLMKIWQPDDSA